MRRNVMDIMTIMAIVILMGVFGFMAGYSADEAVNGKENVETKVVTEINNVFSMTKDYVENRN